MSGGEPDLDAGQGAPRKRRSRWALWVAIALLVGIGLLLVFLLAQATNNRLLYERYYTRLFAINVAVAGVLALVIGWGIYRLLARLRRGKFGSRLLIKLAAIFGLVGVLPGLLIYVVSYQFVSRSIESWFDVKVEGALESGLTLARTSLDTQARDFGNQLRSASTVLAETPEALAALPLDHLRTQLGASDVTLWAASGRLIASAGRSRFQLTPERPSAQMLRNLRAQGFATQIEGLDEVGPAGNAPEARIRALVLVSARSMGLLGEQWLLQAVQPLPTALVTHALAVQEANREYQERALGREGLRRMYIGTLTLSLFLAVFGAVLLAVVLGKQLATPLLMLADGVRQVAAGDLTPKVILPGRDELVGLTRSFADMTQQLSDARAAVDSSMREVDAARAHLQTILDNLTAGVIVLDGHGVIQSANPGATRILRAPLAASNGRPLSSLAALEDFAAEVDKQFTEFEGERLEHGLENWQKSFELYGQGGGSIANDAVTLIARGAALPGGSRLLVFDDISEIVSAQRAQAWGEVARRLAHEIKNPLTPIQLSAERLEHKLADKLPPADQALLSKSVRTIVDQVGAMKRLVNEFRDYARLPAAELKPVDLNALISEVLLLYAANGETTRDLSTPVRLDCDAACPPVLGDAQQLRQVIHNLVQNAIDATDGRVPGSAQAEVVVRTQWLEPSQRVRFSVSDSGHGFSDAILKRAFEPYVTTKAKGTGLGLAVVKKIAEEHGARIDVSNRIIDGQIVGAQVSLSFQMASTAGTALL
ncbi:sensor histidine kinase [Ottowia testudinis]|uniref:histidine kinase n=1 Tax=Ottowia testudinis TaxID=2816950 RepID=A0A975CFU9_9BURK|nr:ATP-binding protein [Ottowia testudinis]QTD45006.1 HAMP domain-containing protein [Ottowia testudinis]